MQAILEDERSRYLLVDVLVARQAILDRRLRVHGYELAFRVDSERAAEGCALTPWANGAEVTPDAFARDVADLCSQTNAFVRFDRSMLLGQWYKRLSPRAIVIEVPASVSLDREALAMCQMAFEQGYRIALDDYVGSPDPESLFAIANLIKVRAPDTRRSAQSELIQSCHARGLKVLATNVDDTAKFEWARSMGYDYFQGGFLVHPNELHGRQIETMKANYLRLLEETQRPSLDFGRLQMLICEDLALVYKLTRYASSALFSRRSPIRSVQQALVTLGEQNVRRWAALVLFTSIAADKPGELITCSLVRGRFCETLSKTVRPQIQHQAFLTGLFSLLDALVDRPMKVILRELDLVSPITSALLNTAPEHDMLAGVYRLACHYERAEWQGVDRLLERFRISPTLARWAYGEALKWSHQVVTGIRRERA
ncbi:MAG TPA: HDOD domain-containing protein [Bryobacteraceae bacterium]|nr:HDOD domain-containing protein [Bryobacteraceae bacterium]